MLGMRSARLTFSSAVILSLAWSLAACKSSTNQQPVPDPTFATAGSGAAPASSTAALDAPMSAAPAGSAAIPGVPAIANATALTVRPVVAAGTGPAPTDLVIRDLVVGTGTVVDTTATVNLKYVGTLYVNGTVFDASWGKAANNEATFPLNGVIPGFAQGLVGMKVGGRREIVIPPALGYGSTASGSIPANSTIVFVVDMESTTG